jgi:hypothetical protein
MTVTPYDGPDAIWAQDQINTSVQQQQDQKFGTPPPASASIPANTPVPGVMVLWQRVPETLAEPPSSSSSSSSGSSNTTAPPVQATFTIDIASIRSGESALLTALDSAAIQYNKLAEMVLNNQNTIFGQEVDDTQWEDPGPYQSEQQVTTSDSIDSYAQNFANGGEEITLVPKGNKINQVKTTYPGMNDQQKYLLSQIATAFSIVGTYLDIVNGATTVYAQTDAYSVLPPVNKGKS